MLDNPHANRLMLHLTSAFAERCLLRHVIPSETPARLDIEPVQFAGMSYYIWSMHAIDVQSWEEFEERLKLLKISAGGEFLFRGQADSCWSLDTTLERDGKGDMLFSDYYRVISVVRPQIETFNGNRWDVPGYPEVEKLAKNYNELSSKLTDGPIPAYSYMAYLRHHGFPSPLLDWSRTPYVAAYFAFRKAGQKNVAIYVYSGQLETFKFRSSDKPQIYTMGPYIQTHRRHFLQRSAYTICLSYSLSDGGWLFAPHGGVFARNNPRQDVLWQFNIPATEREKVLKLLDSYNLNALSLFDSDEALMETMALRHFDFKRGTP